MSSVAQHHCGKPGVGGGWGGIGNLAYLFTNWLRLEIPAEGLVYLCRMKSGSSQPQHVDFNLSMEYSPQVVTQQCRCLVCFVLPTRVHVHLL